jgi:hypothetical protein
LLLIVRALALGLSFFCLSIAVPRLFASVGNLIGDDAVHLALRGEALNTFSYDRAVRSREHALAWRHHGLTYAELGLLHHNQTVLADRGAVEQFGRATEYAAAAAESFDNALALNPIQPTSWLLRAQLDLRDGNRETAADAFAWSLKSGHFHRPLAQRRVELAYLLWDDIDPLTRHRLAPSIVYLARQQPAVLAEITIDASMTDEVMTLLADHQPDGALLVARFYRAASNYLGVQSPLLSQIGEQVAMQRFLASASLLIGVALPIPAFTMTVEEYLAINRGERTIETEADVLQYLTGVLDGVLMTAEVTRMQGTPVFCLTDEQFDALEVGELKVTLDLMLDQFQQEMPNFAELAQNRTVGVATLQLLAYLYPCESPELAN